MPSPLRFASRGIAFAYIARETIERIMPYRQLDEVGHCFPELGAIAVAYQKQKQSCGWDRSDDDVRHDKH